MTTSVNTNVNALAAVQALSVIGNELSDTQSAIETGLKVGSAADNPAVFTIAQGLRAQTGALSAVSDTIETGVATLQGATAGATSIDNALSSLLHVVTQSEGQSGNALTASINAVANLLANINTYANATTVNGVNLLGTDTTTPNVQTQLNVIANINGSAVSVLQQSSDTTTLGLTTGTASTETTATTVTTALTLDGTTTNTAAAIVLVNDAIATVGKTLSTLGSATSALQGLEDFTDQLNTSTTTSIGAISDANLAKESAQLASLQTKQQLATQSLSIANQAPSSLLSLFR